MDQHSTHSEHQEWVRKLAAQAREISVRSFELLKMPLPHTFLRRETHEPPQQEEAVRIDRWLSSKELRPPK
jgi:hypothetical protein